MMRDLRYPPRERLTCLQVEVTTHCNLSCPECSRTLLSAKGAWKNRHMPVETFAEIARQAPPAQMLIAQGVGEPTLHPGFLEMLETAKKLGRFGTSLFYTNGLARPVDYYLRILTSGLADFILSLDSLDPVVAASCRAGTDVVRLRALLAEAAKVATPNVSLVLSRKNLADLPRTLAELNALGPVRMSIQPLVNYRPLGDDDAPNEHALDAAALAEYETLRQGFATRYPHLDFRDAGMDQLRGQDRQAAGSRYCLRPFLHPYVTVEGYLTPCCLVYDPDIYGRTLLTGRTFAEAWDAAPVQGWLHELVTGAPEICRDCVLNPARG